MLKTPKTEVTIVLSIALIISAGICIRAFSKKEKNNDTISAKVFHGLNGWGYDIIVNDKLFIHQESVPGQSGNKGFPQKSQAEEMSKLIINKMENGRLPAVTTFELEQIFPANERQYDEPSK